MEEKKKEVLDITITPEEEEELENKKKSSALTGFIFSLFSWSIGISIVGLVFSILGLVYSVKANKVKSYPFKSFSTVGKALSIARIVLNIVIPILVFLAVITYFIILGLVYGVMAIIAATA